MDIKVILRKYRITNMLGKDTLSKNEKDLIQFLENCFIVYVEDKYAYDDKHNYIYYYNAENKHLYYGVYVMARLTKMGYKKEIRHSLIKDYFEAKFKKEVLIVL